MLKKVSGWLKDSHRWQHLVGGAMIGLLADDVYCAALTGFGVAGALEFKDWQWGGDPDVVDFVLTVSGVAIMFTAKKLFWLWLALY